MKRVGITASLVFFSGMALATPTPSVPQELKLSRTEIFARESTPVTLSVAISSTRNPQSWSVVQVDAEGNRIKAIGKLSDDGVFGDQVRGDGRFTKKFQAYEKKNQTLYYVVVPTETIEAQRFSLEPHTEIQVIGRPSFLEMIRSAFEKAWHRTNESS